MGNLLSFSDSKITNIDEIQTIADAAEWHKNTLITQFVHRYSWAVLGGVLGVTWRLLHYAFNYISEYFYVSVEITSRQSELYDWLVEWLAVQPYASQTRQFHASYTYDERETDAEPR